MPGFTDVSPCEGVCLAGTSLLNCKAGVIGATAGAPYDTLLYGVYIVAGAGPPTLTIGGFEDNTDTAQNLLITGSTSADYFWMPPVPILNSFAAFTFTPSVTLKIFVFLRAYVGPERPGTYVTT
jgi:hypothetical protein